MRKIMLLAAMLAMALAAAAPALAQNANVVGQYASQVGVVDDSVCSQVYNIAVQQYNAGDQTANANALAGANANAGQGCERQSGEHCQRGWHQHQYGQPVPEQRHRHRSAHRQDGYGYGYDYGYSPDAPCDGWRIFADAGCRCVARGRRPCGPQDRPVATNRTRTHRVRAARGGPLRGSAFFLLTWPEPSDKAIRGSAHDTGPSAIATYM
jgi:hypothetical protein